MIGTNTSQEIEALHKALEKVGLSATIGNDSQLEFSSQTGDRETEDLVKKILNTNTGLEIGYFDWNLKLKAHIHLCSEIQVHLY